MIRREERETGLLRRKREKAGRSCHLNRGTWCCLSGEAGYMEDCRQKEAQRKGRFCTALMGRERSRYFVAVWN